MTGWMLAVLFAASLKVAASQDMSNPMNSITETLADANFMQKVGTACPSMSECQLDISAVSKMDMRALCGYLQCVGTKVEACTDLDPESKARMAAAVSVCGSGFSIIMASKFMENLGLSQASIGQIVSCKAIADCFDQNGLDLTALQDFMTSLTSGSGIDFKALCNMVMPTATCITTKIDMCGLSDEIRIKAEMSWKLMTPFCDSVSQGGSGLEMQQLMGMLMGSSQGVNVKDLSSPGCSKVLECTSNAQSNSLATQDRQYCSNMKTAVDCFHKNKDSCSLFSQFQGVADRVDSTYKEKCAGSALVPTMWTTLFGLLLLILYKLL